MSVCRTCISFVRHGLSGLCIPRPFRRKHVLQRWWVQGNWCISIVFFHFFRQNTNDNVFLQLGLSGFYALPRVPCVLSAKQTRFGETVRHGAFDSVNSKRNREKLSGTGFSGSSFLASINLEMLSQL